MRAEWVALLKQFKDPNGCIDDAEELIGQVPDMLEEIARLERLLKDKL